MKGFRLRRAVRGRLAIWLLSTGILVLVFIAGFATARLRPDHAATPRWISGTVTWSNADIHRVLFEADDDSDDTGEYEVAAIGRWNSQGGAYFSSGLPICLAAVGTEFVRTDRRRVELGVISVREPGGSVYRAAVVVRCLK